jgi:hypothetical protein
LLENEFSSLILPAISLHLARGFPIAMFDDRSATQPMMMMMMIDDG